MKNSFKKLGEPARDTPKEIKKGVVKSITGYKLASDMVDLFFCSFGELAQTIFKKR